MKLRLSITGLDGRGVMVPLDIPDAIADNVPAVRDRILYPAVLTAWLGLKTDKAPIDGIYQVESHMSDQSYEEWRASMGLPPSQIRRPKL